MKTKRNYRDDFSAQVKKALAERVAYICSNPQCRCQTIGPKSDGDKSHNVGVAAHICAASPNGPRYDDAQMSSDRASITNGIWLCSNCSTIIDKDPNRFSVELLRKWKADAESEALKNMLKPRSSMEKQTSEIDYEIITNSFGRVHHGYSKDVLMEYCNKAIPAWKAGELKVDWELVWNCQIHIVNSGSNPAKNIQLEVVPLDEGKFKIELEPLLKKNVLAPYTERMVALSIRLPFTGTPVDADTKLTSLPAVKVNLTSE